MSHGQALYLYHGNLSNLVERRGFGGYDFTADQSFCDRKVMLISARSIRKEARHWRIR